MTKQSSLYSDFSIIRKELPGTLLLFLGVGIAFSLNAYSLCDSNWLTSTGQRDIAHPLGKFGANLSHFLFYIFGYAAWAWVLFCFAIGLTKIRAATNPLYVEKIENIFQLSMTSALWFRAALGLFLIILVSMQLSLHVTTNPNELPGSSGGAVGLFLASRLTYVLSEFGTTVFIYFLMFATFLFIHAISIVALCTRIGAAAIHTLIKINNKLFPGRPSLKHINPAKHSKEAHSPFEFITTQGSKAEPASSPQIAQKPSIEQTQNSEQAVSPIKEDIPVKEDAPAAPPAAPPRPQPAVIEPAIKKEMVGESQATIVSQKRLTTEKEFIDTDKNNSESLLPELSLLDVAPPSTTSLSPEILERMSRLLELKLKEFGVDARVVSKQSGPVITLYELELGAGIKVSKISGLERDLARSLSVGSVRVLEVIPGKSVIGLEVPNPNREKVFLSEALSSQAYQQSKAKLPIALGKNIAGIPVVADLTEMPHLLVAGTTGSGKSVAINAMLLSLLYRCPASMLRLILVDPKRIELGNYDGIAHLLTPVITETKQVLSALRWCVAEMESRYKSMETHKVKSIERYNQKIAEFPEEKSLPYIVLVIDEFADMMHQVGKKAEGYIVSLAQKARACGIHLILATQRPTVDVITGLIKSNVPSRLAFQVSSKIDSRTILEQSGAEQLLGRGDSLYMRSAANITERLHGPYVSDKEVELVISYLHQLHQDTPANEIDLTKLSEEESKSDGGTGDEADNEPHYQEALSIIKSTRRVSVSYLQRRLRLGYNHAARLVDIMEKKGIVSPLSSNGKREYIGPEE